MSGSIPIELGNLTNLIQLYLHSNNLTGSIPVELGNLSNLQVLFLNSNSLTGGIPTEMGNLSNLTALWLHNNSLTGSIPVELGNLTSLINLYLHDNSLSGIVPSQLGNLTSVTIVQIQANAGLEGWLPSSMTNMTSMTWFNFAGTSLCERPDAAFQAWLGGLATLISTNVTCNILFADGFESGDLTAWSLVKLGGGDLTVCGAAAMSGSYGLCVGNATINRKWVSDRGINVSSYSVQFRKFGGAYKVKVLAFLDGGGKVQTAWWRVPNNPRLVEIVWGASSGPGNNDGFLQLYINGNLKEAKTGLDNDTYTVSKIRLGVINSPSTFNVNGTFYIDKYKSSDSGYIGP